MFLYLISLILLTYFASQVYTRDKDLFIVLVAIQNGGETLYTTVGATLQQGAGDRKNAGRRRRQQRLTEARALSACDPGTSLLSRASPGHTGCGSPSMRPDQKHLGGRGLGGTRVLHSVETPAALWSLDAPKTVQIVVGAHRCTLAP
jgi:hypothetical protein